MNNNLAKLGCLGLSFALLVSAALAFTNVIPSLGWPWWMVVVPLLVYYVIMTLVVIIALVSNWYRRR